jgi:hypothetical protein
MDTEPDNMASSPVGQRHRLSTSGKYAEARASDNLSIDDGPDVEDEIDPSLAAGSRELSTEPEMNDSKANIIQLNRSSPNTQPKHARAVTLYQPPRVLTSPLGALFTLTETFLRD